MSPLSLHLSLYHLPVFPSVCIQSVFHSLCLSISLPFSIFFYRYLIVLLSVFHLFLCHRGMSFVTVCLSLGLSSHLSVCPPCAHLFSCLFLLPSPPPLPNTVQGAAAISEESLGRYCEPGNENIVENFALVCCPGGRLENSYTHRPPLPKMWRQEQFR
jgi:hypothetical protein